MINSVARKSKFVVGQGKHILTLPRELARLHGRIEIGTRCSIRLSPLPSSHWNRQRAQDLLTGAGFVAACAVSFRANVASAEIERIESLPDTLGRGLRILIVGLNPSPYSAQSGVPYGRPGNRFWPAALGAGLVSKDRDPWHALAHHGVGFTDLVRRTTRRADEVSIQEFEEGFARISRLVSWIKPRGICFVGLSGWRPLVDRKARAGLQPVEMAGARVYLMPHTSGLNASSRLEDLQKHFEAVRDLFLK